MKRDELDEVLREWDAGMEPDREGEEKLRREIMNGLGRPHFGELGSPGYFLVPKKLVYVGAAAAAMVVFACIFLFDFGGGVGVSNGYDEGKVSLTAEEIQGLRKLASEISVLFPEGVRLISLVNDGEVLISTDGRKGVLDLEGSVLIRYVVLKRNEGGSVWEKVHSTSLIAADGEPVELEGTDKGYIWAYPAGNDVYAIESRMKMAIGGGASVSLDYSGGQQLRTPQRVKTVFENDAEYRIYQEMVRI